LGLVIGLLTVLVGILAITGVTALQTLARETTELNSVGLLRTYSDQIELLASSVVEADVRTDKIRLAVDRTLYGIEQISYGLRQFFIGSQAVTSGEFAAYLSNFSVDFPAVEAAEWVPRVAAADRAAFESTSGFTIFEQFGQQRQTALDRPEYFPVAFAEPFAANVGVLGFDLASDTPRRNVLEAARDSAQTSASVPLRLVQSDETTVLIVTPVYSTNATNLSVEQRRAALRGYIVMAVDIERLIDESLAQLPRPAPVLRVQDITTSNPLALYNNPDINADTGVNATVTLDVYGRVWSITAPALVDRTQAILDLPRLTATLRSRVINLYEGNPVVGINGFGAHADENPFIQPTYDRLLNATNLLQADVSGFVAAQTDIARAELLPGIRLHSDQVFDHITTLINLLLDEQRELTAESTRAALVTAAVAGIIALIGVITAFGVIRRVNSLQSFANRIARGELGVQVPDVRNDEIGQIARTLNTMSSELNTVVATLEERIAVRTRDLQTVTDVNQQISTILDPERLLQDVADLTKERFRLYHSHIYLYDAAQQTLVLTAGAGHVGRQMVGEGRFISLDHPASIVASAARARQGFIINDVSASGTFLPNPLLPDTQSELAVPLIARGNLLGVLDVQADRVDFFTQETYAVLELLAGQVANALSNAQLYAEAERTSRHERALGAIDRRIQNAVDVDDILQTAVRELGKALRVPYTAIELQLEDEPTNGHDA
jgi:CHASE1-domain containing sensor protein/putative methionine-R-sulfoxide reductase with GAF domain/HAMP domain-containing protein